MRDIGNSRCKYPIVGECGNTDEWKEKVGYDTMIVKRGKFQDEA